MSARLCILALFAASVSLAAAPPQLPAGAPASWWTKVESTIRDSEYHVTWQGRAALAGFDGAWHAPNRAHGFRTYFTPEGIRVVPRRTDAPAWEWALVLLCHKCNVTGGTAGEPGEQRVDRHAAHGRDRVRVVPLRPHRGSPVA